MLEYDYFKHIICGEDYQVNNVITIHNPTLREISEFGEDKFNLALFLLTRRPYDVAVELDDEGINYQKLSEFELFLKVATDIPSSLSGILIDNVDFTKCYVTQNVENGFYNLKNEDGTVLMDAVIYQDIQYYLRWLYFMPLKIEYDMGNEMGRKFLIDRMRRKRKKAAKEKHVSQLYSICSYLINNNNFKYNYNTISDITLSQLYESYYRISQNAEANNIIYGAYSGNIDLSKIKNKNILNPLNDLRAN